jgi:hypothetical protein
MSKVQLEAQIKTLQTRIVNDTEKLKQVEQQLEQYDLLEGVTVGTTIEFKIGRADTRRAVLGVVKAVKEEPEGVKKYKVEYTPTGEAFDNTFVVLMQYNIDRVVKDEHGNDVGTQLEAPTAE